MLPDLHGFFKWILDALVLLNEFTGQVVVCGKDAGLHKWANWLREDSGSRPYALLLRLPFLFSRTLRLGRPGFWWRLI